MRSAFILIMLAAFILSADPHLRAQSPVTGDTGSSRWPVPSKEEFLNAVAPVLIESSFSRYYLFETADSCSFIKYDYDEWMKYNLQEKVSIVFLNELTEKAYHDKGPSCWQQDKLKKAVCVDWKKGSAIINPFYKIYHNTTLSRKERKTAIRQLEKERAHQPLNEKIVFGFSRPEFTEDGQYAVIDMIYDCGKYCATAYICLFRQTGTGWKLIGKTMTGHS